MNKQEEIEIGKRFLEVYSGILFNSTDFESGQDIACSYDFSDPKYRELKSRYSIEDVAGEGSDFKRAHRICKWIARNVAHKGDFSLTSDIEVNSVSLLDYAFGNGEHGINCVCKAKILVECCLALGIFARRVGLYPNSPFDTDNHVVAEVYDRKRKKWIMLDPTSGGYFTDGKNLLSCLEMRKNFAANAGGTVVLPRQKATNFQMLHLKNLSWNYYYAKNCYFMCVETDSRFGINDAPSAYVLPVGFDYIANRKQNAAFLLATAEKEGWDDAAILFFRHRTESCNAPLIGGISLWNAPNPQT